MEAVLCGCPTVLLPNKHFKTIIARDEVGRFGMAWGTDPKEVEFAKKTVDLAYPNYLKLFDQFATQLDHFIEVTQDAARKAEYREVIKKVILPYEPVEYHLLREAEREQRGEEWVEPQPKAAEETPEEAAPPKPKSEWEIALLVAKQVVTEVGLSGLTRKTFKAFREGGLKTVWARMIAIYRRMTAPPI
ncbi:MAG: hypothetical protein NDJ89_14600 [Oligoflexia bacterium]|nr:hypothetical protein [Oligoflexia bacterium]